MLNEGQDRLWLYVINGDINEGEWKFEGEGNELEPPSMYLWNGIMGGLRGHDDMR